ncbi:MAG: RNA polymerase-binding protein DksA [Gammaproteobacteria bacterium]|nr:MAG: RNA polymerase-binding protein DksA [Gammaproteobacteria bacterium]|tara:strand:+ start:1143 stop:1730 length:588 start_codon:yes stop_codon:yes gene_type:complete
MVTKKKTNSKPKKVQSKTKTTIKAKVKKPALKKAPIKKSISKRKTSKKQIVTNPSDFESFAKTFTPYRPNKTEKYMNKSQKKHFISILSAWKLALETEQEKTEQLIQKDQSNFPDSLDRAAKEEEFMLELRKRERERKLILKIEMSLKDIDDDLYGFCETCGIEIGIKRLEARPTATQCIDCKTVDEIKEKQQFG